jgi:hypothetical protein
MLVGYSKPADMKTLDLAFGLTKSIDASKHKCCVAKVELRQTQYQLLVERIALVAGLKRAARIGFVEGSNTPRVGATALKALICPVDMGLFGREVWVMLTHFGV